MTQYLAVEEHGVITLRAWMMLRTMATSDTVECSHVNDPRSFWPAWIQKAKQRDAEIAIGQRRITYAKDSQRAARDLTARRVRSLVIDRSGAAGYLPRSNC